MLYDALYIARYYWGLIYNVDAVKDYLKATKAFIEKIGIGRRLTAPLLPHHRIQAKRGQVLGYKFLFFNSLTVLLIVV